MNGLHTIYCHKCDKAMTYPYEERGELYHRWCLSVQSSEELQKVVQPDLATDSIDEICRYIDPEVWNMHSK